MYIKKQDIIRGISPMIIECKYRLFVTYALGNFQHLGG